MRHVVAILLLSVLLLGCGPRVQQFGKTVQDPALMTDHFLTRDGKRLPVTRYIPNSPPRAVVVALHGFNMYRGHFQDVGPFFAEQGVALYAYDQRGFGGSPDRGIWGGDQALRQDIRDVIQAVKRQHRDKPVFLMGASMGAAIILSTMAWEDAPQVTGTILVAPAVWGGRALNPFLRFSSWFAAHVMPWNYVSGSGGIRVMASDNIEMLRANGRDKLNLFQTRFDMLWFVTEMMGQGQAAAAKIKGPVLVLYGEKDEIIPKPAVFQMIQQLKTSYRVLLYPEGWHMLLRDLQAKAVWRDILAWIDDRQSSFPSGYEWTKGR